MFEKLRTWIWPVWLTGAIALAIPMFLLQLSVKEAHPPEKFLGLLAVAALLLVWIALRRRWPRLELQLIAFLAIAPPLFCQPRATLAVVAILTAACGFGRSACDWFEIPLRGRAEELVISAGLGFAAWIVALMALGLAGALTKPLIAALLVVALIGCHRGVLRLAAVIREIFRAWDEPGAFAGVQTWFLAVAILILQPVVLSPCLQYDPLATHLAASRYYTLHHALSVMPFNGYTLLPQGFELMMSGADALAGQAAEQMVAPLFLAFTLLALYAIACELGARRGMAIAGAVFGATVPFVQWNGANVKNDVPLAFFLLAALLAYLRWAATGEYRWVLASAFLGAACENVKHTGLLGVAGLAILYLPAALRQPRRARAIALTVAVFLIFGSFWMVRSATVTGNPLYPLLSKEGMPSALAGQPSLLSRIVELALLPLRVQFSFRPAFEGNSAARPGAFFLLFLPGALWIHRRDWNLPRVACLFFTALYLALWSSTWPVPRYAAAPITLLAIGITVGLARALETTPAWLRTALLGSVVFCHVLNCANMAGLSINLTRLEVLAGRMDWDTFLRRTAPGSYPAMAWVRDHAPGGALTLSVGLYARAYFGDPGAVMCILEDGPYPPEAIERELAVRKYTYVILPRHVEAARVFGSAAAVPEFADNYNAVFRLP